MDHPSDSVNLLDFACRPEALNDTRQGRFVTTKDPSNECIGHALLHDEAHGDTTLVCAEVLAGHEGSRERERDGRRF